MSKLDKLINFVGGLPDDVKIHMSSKPITELNNYPQKPGPKPKGLWYDCDKHWIDWVSSEMPEWVSGYNYIYTIHLNKSNILELRSEKEILDFGKEYSFKRGEFSSSFSMSYYIDWGKVANDYAGIEICPYQWGLRMDERTGWYYGWDVASGCIWSPQGVHINFIGFWDNEKEEIVSKDEIINSKEANSLNWYKKAKLSSILKKHALVGPEQMNPQVSSAIQTVKTLLSQVKSVAQNKDFSGFQRLHGAINNLNELLRANSDTRFVPIKSHSDQLLQTMSICLGKLNNNMLTEQDIGTLISSISNYEGDLNSVL